MGEKETMGGDAMLRESPSKASQGQGRESSAPSVSEGVTAGDDWPPGGPASGSVAGGAVPGGSILSAAVSSVGQLGGGKGGAASAAYARLDAAGAEVATGDLDGDGTAESAINNSHSNIKNL